MSEHIRWGLGLSRSSGSVLSRLEQAGLLQRAAAETPIAEFLAQHWDSAAAFVVVGACGAITRLIAPLLKGKAEDPAVVVVDPAGRFAIPLLGGHGGGGESLSQRVAALLGGQAVLSGSSGAAGRLALDSFGRDWGWRRGGGDWDGLMKAAARGQGPELQQEAGLTLWQKLDAAAAGPEAQPDSGLSLQVSHRQGPGCRWHPPCLWLGIGCERGTSLSLLVRAVDQALSEYRLAPQAVAGLASADRKGDEPALLALAQQRGWPLRLFGATSLAPVTVPTPSLAVEKEMGTASVAEAAALLAAGPEASLLVNKRIERAAGAALGLEEGPEQGAATVAIAKAASQWSPAQGHLHLVGSGPGGLDLLTPDARQALALSTVWVGYGLYLDLVEPLRRPDQWRCDGQLTQERQRCAQALDLASQGLTVALVSSGDSGIYGMAGLALELWLKRERGSRPGFSVHPGLSALQLAAARAGAPLMHDFCAISLSDRLTPWPTIERRLRAAASGDFVVALYNPRSLGRDWQLAKALELLAEGRSTAIPVVLGRQLGRQEEQVSLHRLGDLRSDQVDMLSLVLVGNSTTRLEEGRIVTPRGYPGAELD